MEYSNVQWIWVKSGLHRWRGSTDRIYAFLNGEIKTEKEAANETV